MTDIKKLDDKVCVSPQVRPEEVAALAEAGYTTLINNRPDDEEAGQPTSKQMHEAAEAAGLAYAHVPVGHGISPSDVHAMKEALAACEGKALAFCRSGTRSTMLWAIAQGEEGRSRDEIEAAAAAAGYDLTPIRHLI